MRSPLNITLGEVRRLARSEFVERMTKSLATEFSRFPISPDQIDAWRTLCTWIHEAGAQLDTTFDSIGCLFEFSPPFKGDRSDLLLVSESEILVVEAKTGSKHTKRAAQKQVLRYAYQIYNALEVGVHRRVLPLVIQEKPLRGSTAMPTPITDHAYPEASVAVISKQALASEIQKMTPPNKDVDILDTSAWVHQPRGSVIAFAQEMFGNIRDRNVLTALANSEEIDRLVSRLHEIISVAREKCEHRVVVITGRPGSGKTLVGLRLAHLASIDTHGSTSDVAPVYISGNGPLVEVLREAIARSYLDSVGKSASTVITKRQAVATAEEIILSVGSIDSENFRVGSSVVVFDEAQRAWTAAHLQRKRGNKNLKSQPFEILRKMQDKPWAVVICLVGTGQHINSGEEGMGTWYDAIEATNLEPRPSSSMRRWRISVANKGNSEAPNVEQVPDLELSVDMRARDLRARATRLNEWVNLLLEHQIEAARECREDFGDYPLHVTRQLHSATEWLKVNTNFKYDETAGLIASSGSERLTPYGIRVVDVRDFRAANWYLAQPPHLDACSSFDIAASEFGSQGLELDRVCVCWSWDLISADKRWISRRLDRPKGNWSQNTNSQTAEHTLNAYRVLLTRSRMGMVIWVPEGDSLDPSRDISEADTIAEALVEAGCTFLPS